ncbi:MAG: B12-binding domain-containing radical SAM protein, partial [Candidatus Cloacimonetes bacterium]|nr:B12-binding domain-containing radical SAM protein [Candidatus Cloacimonadota bacterium]
MKKRILLLSMPNYTVGFYKGMRVPSLGLSSLSGNLDSSFVERVIIADLLMVQHNIKNYIIKLLKRFHPHIVGLTCMSFQYETAVTIAELIKQFDQDIIIVLGGYHPTLAYELISESKEKKYIDYLVRCEGEVAFNRLIKALSNNDDVTKISNLSFKEKGNFVHNPRQTILDLENIKLPDRSSRITKHYSIFGKKADVVETSRGCTMGCDFCCMPQMYGRTFRKYPVERVIADIQKSVQLGARAIFFIDDNIFVNPAHLEELCEQILKNGLQDVHYTIQASVVGIARDPNLVKLMAQAGFKIVFLGIESIKKENVRFLSKDKRVLEETSNAIELLRK